MTLSQVQRLFAKQLTDPGAQIDPSLLALLLTDRVQVYQGNFLGAQIRALVEIYPIIQKILGPIYFGQLTREFVLSQPYHQRDLNLIGQAFPEWLSRAIVRHTELAEFAYLPEMAQLELAHDQACYAASSRIFDFASFKNKLATHGPDRITLLTPPSLRLLTLNWPVDRLWSQQHSEQSTPITDEPPPLHLAVLRQQTTVVHLRLNQTAYEVLYRASQGTPLAILAELAGPKQIPDLIASGLIDQVSVIDKQQ